MRFISPNVHLMKSLAFTTVLLLSFTACQEQSGNAQNISPTNKIYTSTGEIPAPEGYRPIGASLGSFGFWLSQVALKKDKTVYLYDGSLKRNQQAQFAVLDISVGNKDLQQCADAVMRLRAEYLYAQERYSEIVFKDDNNKSYTFTTPYTRDHFMRYMNNVFSLCGTHSLEKQLRQQSAFTDIQPGDILIKGGFPGHAVIVMRVVQNEAGHKLYLLAQSYMPAQDIHILVNPNNSKLSPWYDATAPGKIQTPEWMFEKQQLRKW
ncbi:MAG: hypothetical protein J0I41_18440 [Filimonas sp.]|nr:hypothetical protein [Filimonas sp.]